MPVVITPPPPTPGFFYTRFQWSGGTLDFAWPSNVVLPDAFPVTGSTVVASGKRETLWLRIEPILILAIPRMSSAESSALVDWWYTHAWKGGQTAITLDRLNTCAGQWEYDRANTFFDKAEVITGPFQYQVPAFGLRRHTTAVPLYQAQFTFRQGY